MKTVRKLISVLAAAALFLNNSAAISVINAEQSETYIHGDMNYDGTVDIRDCLLLKAHMLEEIEWETIDLYSADINDDGWINAEDFLLLQCYMSGTLSALPFFEYTEEEKITESPLIPSAVAKANSCTQSVGTAGSLNFFVEFNDARFKSEKLSEQELNEELFGNGKTSFPFESVKAFLERSSYGNFSVEGEAVYCYIDKSINDYSSKPADRERLVMDIMKSLDDRFDYSDFDYDRDGDIDILTVTLPLDNAGSDVKKFWYGATHTWYYNPDYKADGVRIRKFIGNDVNPYWNKMYYFKQTYLHELGHCMGLSDYYKYASDDYEGLKGNAGYCRMDDSIGDYCTFSKLMLGWLREDEVQVYDLTAGGLQSFTLDDAGKKGSCVIIPGLGWDGTFNSEYFIIEYISDEGNNMDVKNYLSWSWSEKNNTGFRILHVNAEMFTDYWGRTDFKYDNYSEKYNGDDKQRILRLVNNSRNSLFKKGDQTDKLMSYGSDGYEDADSGYKVVFTGESDGKYSLTVER